MSYFVLVSLLLFVNVFSLFIHIAQGWFPDTEPITVLLHGKNNIKILLKPYAYFIWYAVSVLAHRFTYAL